MQTFPGPFFFRRDEADNTWTCAFRVAAKHLNGGGFLHGGVMMAFADFSLFVFASHRLVNHDAVTVSLHGDFLTSACLGDLVLAKGEVVKDGQSLIFLRGLLATDAGTPLLNYTGVVKRVRRRAAGQDSEGALPCGSSKL